MMLAITASKWLQAGPRSEADQLEGNPVQRNIYTVMLAIALVVLVRRGPRVWALLRMNAPIVLFFAYCLMSTLWSDFTGIAFKRWIKAIGDLVMVLLILTEADRLGAIKRFQTRVAFFLVPISILLIQYFPALGREYKPQDGRQGFIGVTNDKNMLGVICLLFGLAALWRLLHLLRQKPRRSRQIVSQGVILTMVVWLFIRANSMTSLACFALAGILMVAVSTETIARRRFLVHGLAVSVVVLAAMALFFNVGSDMVKTLGRDPTLTGRTELWQEIVGMNDNPVLGTGFESFWMGSRLDKIWDNHWWHPNEAHNGYLEVYLNLGWLGVILLLVIFVSGYRNALNLLRREPETGRLILAYFIIGVIYSFTEAGFRLLNPVWITFMMASIAAPRTAVAIQPSATSGRAKAKIATDAPLAVTEEGVGELVSPRPTHLSPFAPQATLPSKSS